MFRLRDCGSRLQGMHEQCYSYSTIALVILCNSLLFEAKELKKINALNSKLTHTITIVVLTMNNIAPERIIPLQVVASCSYGTCNLG